MPQDENLFEGTKMTFGEHLEELRVCLIKAVLGLMVGVALGFAWADDVVRAIQSPLEIALQEFYKERTQNQMKEDYGGIRSDLNTFVDKERLIAEEVYCELSEIRRVGGVMEATPPIAPEAPAPQASAPEASAPEASPVSPESAAAPATSAVPRDPASPPNASPTEATPPTASMSPTGDVLVGAIMPPAPSTPLVKLRIWKRLDAEVTSLSAHEPFMIWMKAALITGAIIASPWIFLQVWNFVAAGLYPHEKGLVYFFLPMSLGLFFAGAALAFFFVFKPVLQFLFSFNSAMNIDPDPRISEWMSFVLLLPLGFGVSFQLPLVMLIVHRLGIVSTEAYLDKWRIAILGIFIVSMVLTPADPISMLLMACPLSVLYFGGILLCKYLPGRSSPFGEGYDPQ